MAEPFLKDNYFSHGVVSLIDYLPEEGATGIVMNNCTDYMLSDLLEGTQPEVDLRVFCGGPLGLDRLYFVHTLGSDIVPGAREYSPGLYVGGDFDAVLDYINCGFDTNGIIRFFIGYSNWAPGQLDAKYEKAHGHRLRVQILMQTYSGAKPTATGTAPCAHSAKHTARGSCCHATPRITKCR